ncbi:hypothetical protein CCHR01_16530 [Colletotrichum chrysophilum]|uniref:Uncharacterized protein n=1 Tax=Colletotrichum chrysophilum TaxID=1836956 RepID=A0AAD9A3L3_9PEZI|nr:hypothetical protein K456DRAFT_695712 [Colletotrichum gloeosporioides 23]KAK1840851.1 hypothetical protein CCHR01_16530 [Colletotrichum chrysophilum]
MQTWRPANPPTLHIDAVLLMRSYCCCRCAVYAIGLVCNPTLTKARLTNRLGKTKTYAIK